MGQDVYISVLSLQIANQVVQRCPRWPCKCAVWLGSIANYRNAIMFCVNFTFANFASADGIAKKRSQ